MHEQELCNLLAFFLKQSLFSWSSNAPFFSIQDLYYAFKKDWCYWQKGKKSTKSWSSREEYDAMLHRLQEMKKAKKKAQKKDTAKGGKKKSKGIKRRLRGQALGYAPTKRVPCLPLF